MSRPLTGCALALLLSACGDGTGPFLRAMVVTDKSEYRPGEKIVVTTLNRSDDDIYDDHCGGSIEGFEYLGEWNGSYGVGRACLDAGLEDRGVRIPPGAEHVDVFYVNTQSYAGTWRVRLELEAPDGSALPLASRVSRTFRVVVD